MQESVTLFESVANSRYFSETSVILFLNKIDLFAAKLASGTKLQDYCPDYSGPNEYEPAYVDFLLRYSANNHLRSICTLLYIIAASTWLGNSKTSFSVKAIYVRELLLLFRFYELTGPSPHSTDVHFTCATDTRQ
jgi:hypothetical protein